MAKLNLGGLSLMIAIFLLTWTEYANCKVDKPFCDESMSSDKKADLYYKEVCEKYGSKPTKRVLREIERSGLNVILEANANKAATYSNDLADNTKQVHNGRSTFDFAKPAGRSTWARGRKRK